MFYCLKLTRYTKKIFRLYCDDFFVDIVRIWLQGIEWSEGLYNWSWKNTINRESKEHGGQKWFFKKKQTGMQ